MSVISCILGTANFSVRKDITQKRKISKLSLSIFPLLLIQNKLLFPFPSTKGPKFIPKNVVDCQKKAFIFSSLLILRKDHVPHQKKGWRQLSLFDFTIDTMLQHQLIIFLLLHPHYVTKLDGTQVCSDEKDNNHCTEMMAILINHLQIVLYKW